MSDRFFNYSSQAPEDFREKLEAQVTKYEQSDSGLTYTPIAASILLSLLGVGITVLNNIYENKVTSNSLSALVAGLPVVGGLVAYICKTARDRASFAANALIIEGVTDGFFKTPPVQILPVAFTDGIRTNAQIDLEIDATKMRLLGPKI
jgi:hypothetical protein